MIVNLVIESNLNESIIFADLLFSLCGWIMSTNHLTEQVADHVTLQHGPKYVFAFHAYCSGVHVLHLC